MAARYGFALAAACGVLAFATLGAWQLQRGIDKRERLAQQDEALRGDVALPLREALTGDATAIRRVAGRGRLLPPLLLLDQQQRAGKVGLRVYALAEVEAAQRVLVDLGWVALPPDRQLPVLQVPEGTRELRGLLTPWPGQGLRLAPNPWPTQPRSPVLLHRLEREEIATALQTAVAAPLLRLAPDLDYGYTRDLELWPNTLPPERHYGYAVQWFALAATVAIVYFLLSRRARRRTLR